MLNQERMIAEESTQTSNDLLYHVKFGITWHFTWCIMMDHGELFTIDALFDRNKFPKAAKGCVPPHVLDQLKALSLKLSKFAILMSNLREPVDYNVYNLWYNTMIIEIDNTMIWWRGLHLYQLFMQSLIALCAVFFDLVSNDSNHVTIIVVDINICMFAFDFSCTALIDLRDLAGNLWWRGGEDEAFDCQNTHQSNGQCTVSTFYIDDRHFFLANWECCGCTVCPCWMSQIFEMLAEWFLLLALHKAIAFFG